MRLGSSTPGSSTTMRSSPWRVICGSATPVSSMRRRTISMDCCTADSARARSAAGARVSVTRPSGVPSTVNSSGTAGGIARSAASAAASCEGSRSRSATRLGWSEPAAAGCAASPW